jgi:hypothetical protein
VVRWLAARAGDDRRAAGSSPAGGPRQSFPAEAACSDAAESAAAATAAPAVIVRPNPKRQGEEMIRILCAAALFGLATAPAAGADLGRGYFVPAPAFFEPSPFYLVDQGPMLTGPGIMITEIGIKPTDLRRSYPYIGRYDDFTRFAVTTDFYGVPPATLDPGSRFVPHHVHRKPWRHRRVRARY